MDKFQEYLKTFEDNVILPMFKNRDVETKRIISIKPDRLHSTKYGEKLGTVLPWEFVGVVDYYGLHKKTIGFLKMSQEFDNSLSLRVSVLSFPSIHLEDIVKYCPDIVSEFSRFKLQLLELRGFKIPRR